LNGDGIVELLVNNHENNKNTAGIFAYEIPSNYRNDEWKKHTLALGFECVKKLLPG